MATVKIAWQIRRIANYETMDPYASSEATKSIMRVQGYINLARASCGLHEKLDRAGNAEQAATALSTALSAAAKAHAEVDHAVAQALDEVLIPLGVTVDSD